MQCTTARLRAVVVYTAGLFPFAFGYTFDDHPAGPGSATEACSVALLHDGQVTSHYEVIPRQHAQKLLPMIKQLLADAGVALNAVDAIAFGRGPGAFTGVRIAIGVVQGLAFALQRPVLPVSNLAALAQGALRQHGVQQVAAAIDARPSMRVWTRCTGAATRPRATKCVCWHRNA